VQGPPDLPLNIECDVAMMYDAESMLDRVEVGI
jgi:hypothetical protein